MLLLFSQLAKKLATISPAHTYIDWNRDIEPTADSSILIDIEIDWQTDSQGLQTGIATINLKISQPSPEDSYVGNRFDKSLEPIKFFDTLHYALQGWSGIGFNGLMRTKSYRDKESPSSHITFIFSYQCAVFDNPPPQLPTENRLYSKALG